MSYGIFSSFLVHFSLLGYHAYIGSGPIYGLEDPPVSLHAYSLPELLCALALQDIARLCFWSQS